MTGRDIYVLINVGMIEHQKNVTKKCIHYDTNCLYKIVTFKLNKAITYTIHNKTKSNPSGFKLEIKIL